MTTTSIAFDQAADYYDETRGFPAGVDRQIGAFIAEQVGFTADSRLLEIGVGTGRIALPVAQHTGLFVGVDLALPMIGKLRQKQQREFAETRLEVLQGDVMHLPLANHSFDAALVVHILHLVGDMERTVHELARVLKPGAKVVQCWNQDNRATFAPLLDAWNAATGGRDTLPSNDRWKGTLSIFERMGWQGSAEHVFPYMVHQSPESVVDRYRRRVYSHMWSMPDDVWQRGVDNIEQALRTHYADPQQVQDVQHEFFIRVYTVPTSA